MLNEYHLWASFIGCQNRVIKNRKPAAQLPALNPLVGRVTSAFVPHRGTTARQAVRAAVRLAKDCEPYRCYRPFGNALVPA